MCTDGSLSRILPGIIISGGKLVGLKKMCPKNVTLIQKNMPTSRGITLL